MQRKLRIALRLTVFRRTIVRLLTLAVGVGLTCLLVLTPAPTARADYGTASQAFNSLTEDEKWTVPAALVATGDFNARFFGEFTHRLYAAIQTFQSREGFAPTGILDTRQRALLYGRALEFLDPLGLVDYQLDNGVKISIPRALFDTEKRPKGGYLFQRKDDSLSLSFEIDVDRTFEDLFLRLTSPSGGRIVSYKVLRPSYFVSSGTFKGKAYYSWILRTEVGPSGFTLSWSPEHNALANRLTTYLANTIQILPESPEATTQTTPPEQASTPPGNTSGTGFLISASGHLLTNRHVVTECMNIAVRRGDEASYPAQIVTSDPANDLALLKTTPDLGKDFARFRKDSPLKAGEDVVVFGFPLPGALSVQGNVLPGTVAALAGLGDDNRFLQISAPVQPGNSGGPLLDRSGNVVGIVQSKLNAIEIAGATGDIPQNVNFAIKSEVVMEFLDWAGSRYETAASSDLLPVFAIARQAVKFTVLVECIRS